MCSDANASLSSSFEDKIRESWFSLDTDERKIIDDWITSKVHVNQEVIESCEVERYIPDNAEFDVSQFPDYEATDVAESYVSRILSAKCYECEDCIPIVDDIPISVLILGHVFEEHLEDILSPGRFTKKEVTIEEIHKALDDKDLQQGIQKIRAYGVCSFFEDYDKWLVEEGYTASEQMDLYSKTTTAYLKAIH